MAVASVVIPAHNEGSSIGRTLRALRTGVGEDDLDVVVVCNGCTDATAAVARQTDPRALVIEIAQPSKVEAVRVGNAATHVFPRVHLDADIELSGASVLDLLEPITRGQALATAPLRTLPRERLLTLGAVVLRRVGVTAPGRGRPLRPRRHRAVGDGARHRVGRLSVMMNDDLAMSDAFSPEERRIVTTAVAVIRPPRTVADLVRRRIRVATGNAQAARTRRPTPGIAHERSHPVRSGGEPSRGGASPAGLRRCLCRCGAGRSTCRSRGGLRDLAA